MKKLYRYIFGYIVGIIFVFLFPFLLYKLNSATDVLIGIKIINNIYLQIIISTPFLLTGLLLGIWSNIFLFKIGKGGPTDGFGVAVTPRTKKLVTEGPYRYSRNPMVFGAFLAYFGLAIYLDSLICILVLIFFFILMIIYLKLIEEKRLLKDFGHEFIEYKNKVPMIIPFLKLNYGRIKRNHL
jgi:protein-S-isoprenylcysteine O-methyltransferase Ste14